MKKTIIALFLLTLFLSCAEPGFDNPADRENIDYTAPRLISAGKGEEGVVTLTWRANQGDISRYIIYRGTTKDNLKEIDRVDGGANSYRDRDFLPPESTLYLYAVKAVLIAGEISELSNIETGYISKTHVPFGTEALRQAVLEAAGKSEIFMDDAAALESLDLANKNISGDLEGIEYFFSLRELKLGNNQISDISHLRQLKGLIELDLTGNLITDLHPLLHNRGIGTGDSIKLNMNPLSFKAVDEQVLALQARGVTIDEAAIKHFTFKDPALEKAVRDAIGKPLGEKIYYRDIADLTTLSAENRNIRTLEGIERLTPLTRLNLNQNNISDITELKALQKLQRLDLGNNQIAGLGSLLANEGVGAGDILELKGNPLDMNAVNVQIPALAGKDVQITKEDFTPIIFTDPNLEAAVREVLEKPEGAVCSYEVVELTTLSLEDKNISTLEGLENFTSLNELYLNINTISSIEPLESLKELKHLELTGNMIKDLSPLLNNGGIGAGDTVRLKNNPLSITAAEEQIPRLKAESVDVDEVTLVFPDPGLEAAVRDALGKSEGDIYPADVNSLTTLKGAHRNISDLWGLWHLRSLTNLDLNGNKIADLSHLALLEELEKLHLGNNNISSLQDLPDFRHLSILDLSNNKIENLRTFPELNSLTSLHLDTNKIKDLSGLPDLPDLLALTLSGNGLTNESLEYLSKFQALTLLSLDHNNLTSLDNLPPFPVLLALSLSSNKITDISGLRSYRFLTLLDLAGNEIRTLEGHPDLPLLTTLILRSNYIDDLSGLRDFPLLSDFDLNYNRLVNLEVLLNKSYINKGDKVYLAGNRLSDEAKNVQVPALREKGVVVRYLY